VSICQSIDLTKVVRIEKSRRYKVMAGQASSPAKKPKLDPEMAWRSFAQLVHDRMTECMYPNGILSFEQHIEPEKWTTVPVMSQGAKALEDLSKAKGLGYDEQDIAYYLRVFKDELKRDPTEVECFDLAQGNSEHSRHWFFGGKAIIDGVAEPKSLFEWVKRPLKEHPSNSVIGFHDNSSALRGFQFDGFMTDATASSGPFGVKKCDYDLTLTVETHNFPCGIAPFPGSETGAGGRIRDGESTGKGSLVVAAVAGYAVGNLHIPGYKLPWECEDFKYPSNMAPPLQIIIDCSNGASDYGNKFGEPLICGWTRSCGVRMPDSK
jgi:phosphoribosylformylglycinamidine synthase